jgi:transposase InsO family protein
VVLDLFSRRVVGWSMNAREASELVADALMMAIWRRGRPKDVLHYSDCGSEYGSEAFQRLLADQGIICSMSRAGNVWDNVAVESFFSSTKTERVSRKIYRTRDDARADVFDYIERFYNPHHRHSTLGYESPIAFEVKMRVALTTFPRNPGQPMALFLSLVPQPNYQPQRDELSWRRAADQGEDALKRRVGATRPWLPPGTASEFC